MQSNEEHIEALKNAIKQNEQAVALMRSLLEDVERRRAESLQKHFSNEARNSSESAVQSRSLAA